MGSKGRIPRTGDVRRTRRGPLLRWGFAAVVVCGLLLDVFSFGHELGKEFVGWDMDVMRLGRQSGLDDIGRNLEGREQAVAPSPAAGEAPAQSDGAGVGSHERRADE